MYDTPKTILCWAIEKAEARRAREVLIRQYGGEDPGGCRCKTCDTIITPDNFLGVDPQGKFSCIDCAAQAVM